MFTSIEFHNFKALRATTLQLSPFTLIVGPNGSGKSTVFQAMEMARTLTGSFESVLSVHQGEREQASVRVDMFWGDEADSPVMSLELGSAGRPERTFRRRFSRPGAVDSSFMRVDLIDAIDGLRGYAFEPEALRGASSLDPKMELALDGGNLANVLDRLRDHDSDRFEQLNAELNRWFPEFDRVVFDTPRANARSIGLRTAEHRHVIPATELSHGTLVALAMLTLAYVPKPPAIIFLEEPDRGLHPRLLRELQDAMYRLCYPAEHGANRKPVQVIATTHAPYFLDLFRETPEEVVIATKVGLDTTFQRLSDMPDIQEILDGTSLGEIWYTGILGGVPAVP